MISQIPVSATSMDFIPLHLLSVHLIPRDCRPPFFPDKHPRTRSPTDPPCWLTHSFTSSIKPTPAESSQFSQFNNSTILPYCNRKDPANKLYFLRKLLWYRELLIRSSKACAIKQIKSRRPKSKQLKADQIRAENINGGDT